MSAGLLAQGTKTWKRLSPDQKAQLAVTCQTRGAASSRNPRSYLAGQGVSTAEVDRLRAATIATGIDSYYADTSTGLVTGSNTEDSIQSACESVIHELAQKAQEAAEHGAERATEALKESVAHGTFIAVNGNVRKYMEDENIATGADVRKVACMGETVCEIAFNGDDPAKHPILAAIFGRPDDPESQLIEPMTSVFKAVFADRHIQTATISQWIDLQTIGGKIYKAPALSITCDRASANQIDWDNVKPEGLKQLCNYKLLPK